MEETKHKLWKLKPLIGKQADDIWLQLQSGDKFQRARWTQIVETLLQKYGLDTVDDNVVLPPPDWHDSLGDIPLGLTEYPCLAPYQFNLRLPELTRHMGIFGSTGTGKTTLAKNLLREMLERNIPFLVFDWENNYRDLIKDDPRVKVFTIGSETAPFRFNFFELPPGLTYQDYVKEVINVFSRAYLGGVGSDSVMLKIFDQAYQIHGTPKTSDAMDLMTQDMAGNGNMKGREMLWKQSSLRMLQFLSYGGTGRIFNTDESVRMPELMNDFIVFELGGLASPRTNAFSSRPLPCGTGYTCSTRALRTNVSSMCCCLRSFITFWIPVARRI
jgi:hypothetical protein